MKNKFNFFLSALLVLLFIILSSTCFATGNLTNNDFRELLIDNNININSDTEIPSSVTTILNQYPIIIKSSDNSKVYIFGTPFDVTSQDSFTKVIIAPYTENNVLAYSLGITNGTNYFTYKNNIQENIYTSSLSRKRVVFDVETQTFEIAQYFYFNKASSPNSRDFSNSPANGRFGLIYDSNKYTVEDFNNIKTLKNYLNKNLLFNGVEKIIFPGGIDIFYKFDGVFKGNGTQEPYTSSFTVNNIALRFEYTAYTDLTNSKVVNYFYLQEFTPSEAVNLTDEDLNFTDSDEQIVINEKLESNFSYTSMIRKMQQGYIYRLYCFSNQHNESGDLIRTTDSTSCFFSLNTWKSNSITVLNIYNLLFPENPDIEQEGGTGVDSNNSIEDYWGNINELNPEDFENELENNFNGIMENLSGELSQNQIFQSLGKAENIFLDFFKDEQYEEFYDLKFSWPDVKYMGTVLIPAGGFNISEMCREIPELESLRAIIRVIFNFSVALSLIKQIYNLILSTLGIDNPYLYEDYDEVTSVDEDTGEFKQMAYKRKRVYRKRR